MKKFINYIKSPSSDFALLVILLILLNLVSLRAFFRMDLTRTKSYSISPATKQLLSTLSTPLSVKAFFSENLSAPYNTTRQYVQDMLVEYKTVANKNFSYDFMDMSKSENETLASQYGLQQRAIQEVKNNEVGFKNAYMGLAIVYGDSIELIDGISSTEGFEYKLTTTMAKMIATTNTLAAMTSDNSIKLSLYLSDALKQFQISGINEVEDAVRSAFENVNKQNMERMVYEKINPSESEIEALQNRYGIQAMSWQQSATGEGRGALGLVLEYGDSFRLIPLSLQRSLFGNIIAGLESLEKNMNDSLHALLSNITQIAYVTGHGEQDLYTQQGQSPFSQIVSDMYEFVSLNLSEDDIPATVSTIIINGAKSEFSEQELYKIDQFVMRGGNAMFFVDSLVEMESQNYYQQSTMLVENKTNISRLLDSYGVKVLPNIVFDENCYKTYAQSYGNVSLYWVPTIARNQLAKKHPITYNLDSLFFIQSSPLDVSGAKEDSRISVTELVKSSEKSWRSSESVQLDPLSITPPYNEEDKKSETLAVLLEGNFKSAFEGSLSESTSNNANSSHDNFNIQSHLASSVQSGKIFVAGSSGITGSQVSDGRGAQPIEMFVRNSIDYLNSNEDLCTMRTKGSLINMLHNGDSALAVATKYFNEFGLSVLVVIAGLFVWTSREKRRKKIHDKYNPNDTRTIKKDTIKNGEGA